MKAVGTEADAAVCDKDEGDGGAVAPLLSDQTLQSLGDNEQYHKRCEIILYFLMYLLGIWIDFKCNIRLFPECRQVNIQHIGLKKYIYYILNISTARRRSIFDHKPVLM